MSGPSWRRIERGGLVYYAAENFESTGLVRHGYSTRLGGVSGSPYESLNMGLLVGDDHASVLSNRRLFGTALGISPERIIVPHQVHSDSVRVVDESHAGSGAMEQSTTIPDTDALISDIANLPLALHFADCVSIFLLDPRHHAIGLVHAGWKGTALGVLARAVQQMALSFQSDPQSMLAAIGPSIGPCCYEVRRDVRDKLLETFSADDRILTGGVGDRWHADLKLANLILLKRAGLQEPNIAVSTQCTSCHDLEFFSYRRDGNTGRMSAWLSLTPLS